MSRFFYGNKTRWFIGIIVDVMSRDARENLFDNVDSNDHVVTKENEGLWPSSQIALLIYCY